MLLIDYSQVCIVNVMQFQNDLQKTKANPEAVNIIRHAILTGIKSYKKKFPTYGPVVLACDGQNYWRKNEFPYYKIKRKSSREESDLDWKLIFDTMSDLREDIKNHFPYKVIHINQAEADDVIATLAEYTQTNELKDHGMFEEKQPVMILSSDHDFKQLQKYDNVKQWSPQQKKFVVSHNPRVDLIEKILVGDAGDGIPNVCSKDDIFTVEGRQTPFRKNRIDEFVQNGKLACKNDIERHGWDRNNRMINFEFIPEAIKNDIIRQYEDYIVKGDKMSIYNYLVSKRCRLLLNEIEEF